ncbi:MAG TPA: acetoin dehydrogenase dihydrolipoyllysine-residue acetyltransferase subunit [Burkholderiaceae bacterium]|nr:acetoin dehydrogenase dihydrolipoyllysine-residue acetyltransferase subunit [Burkholderiaceae bacterium]
MAAITPIVMPKWGLSMSEGRVNAWLVEEGARIEVGAPILEVETDKISGVVEAADAGLLRRKVAQPGQTLPVKALLGVMAPPDVPDSDLEAFIAAYVVPAGAAGEEEGAAGGYEFVEVDGIRVRYARKGSGATTVLFLHGYGGDLDNWLFNLDALADRNTVLALDLPGHGQSACRLPDEVSVAALAGFLAHFLDAVNVQRVHVVGHSLGGAIAAQLALDQGDRVESLALIGSAGLGEEINKGYTEGFVAAQSRRELKPVIEQLFFDAEAVSRQMIDDLLKYKRLDGVSELLSSLAAAVFGGGRQREQPVRRLAGTGKRVLVIWGKEDRIIPASHAANAPRGATVRVIDDAGHMVQMEKASVVNKLLRQHIEG